MECYCLIQVRLEGRNTPVDIGYSQGTSVQAVLERACKTLGIYDSWNYALYSELFKTWLYDSHLLSSYPEEDTLVVRKKTPEYLELRNLPTTLNPNLAAQPKRKGVFGGTKSIKTSLKTRFHAETIYLTTILFTSDNKILITSGSSKMFPTIEVIRDEKIFGNFEDDSEEFAHVIRTSLDWSTFKEVYNDSSSDSDSFHSMHSSSSACDFSEGSNTMSFSQYINDESIWSHSFGYAALKLKSELSLESLGIIYEHVVSMNSSKSKFIVALQYVPSCIKDEIAPDLVKTGTLKWKNFDEINNIYHKDSHPIWSTYIEKWCSRQTKLSPGLYLGVLYTESTLQSIKILVPKDRKQFIPLGKIRDEAMITAEETSWIKSLTCLSQDCFMDLVMATKNDDNRTTLGQFQTSFINSYHKLQHDTGLKWEVNDIYCEQTVDVYLDLRTNHLYTMTSELEDNAIDHYGTSLHNDLYLDHNMKSGAKNIIFNKRNSKQQYETLLQQDDRKHSSKSHPSRGTSGGSHKTFESMISYQEEMKSNLSLRNDSHNEFMEKEKEILVFDKSNPESEDEEAGSNVKTSTSTGAATSVCEETIGLTASPLSNTNSIRPFIRIILIVKPMRQIHQISMTYQSRLCMLYPFTLYDALQHATFNTSLYACSRRAMQILQASRTYFAQELLRRLQAMDNFSDVNEQNIEDFFFEPDELPKVPEETKKIKQCLDIVRDEISILRQQWNSASWVMTAIEWDRQRTMKSYNFGSRSLSHNFSRKSMLSNRSTSIRSSNRESDNSSMIKGKSSDTASQIETLRDTIYHAPDRAWNNIRLLGKMAANKPIPPLLALYLSSLPSVSSKNRASTSSTVDNKQNNMVNADNQQNNTVNVTQIRKKSTLMKTLRLGKRNQQNSIDELSASFSQSMNTTNKDNKISDKDTTFEGKEEEETITINILPPVIQPINASGPITLLTPTFIKSLQDHEDKDSEVNQDVSYSKAIDDIIIESIDADDNDMKFMNDEQGQEVETSEYEDITSKYPSEDEEIESQNEQEGEVESICDIDDDKLASEIHAIEEEIHAIDTLLDDDTCTVDIVNIPHNSEETTSVDCYATKHDTLEVNDIPLVVKKTSKSDDKSESFEEAGDDTERNTTGETNETNADTVEIDVKTTTSNNLDLVTEDNETNDITETNVSNSDDAVLDAMIDAIVDVNNNVNTKHSESSADLEKLLPNDSSNDSSNDAQSDSLNDSPNDLLNNSPNDSSNDSSNNSSNETPLSLVTSSTAQPHLPPSSSTVNSTLDNSSQSNVPLGSDSTSYFSDSHVIRSIPPTPTTPYFPAVANSTEVPTHLPEFLPEPIYGMPEQSVPNSSPLSEPEFEPINPFLIPPMPTSTYISPETPLPSTPTTPLYSPSLQESRPVTPLLSKLSLFEELRQATSQQNSDKGALCEDLNQNKSPSIQTQSSPPHGQHSLTPRDSPPVSPSSLPPPSLLTSIVAISPQTLSTHTSYSLPSQNIHSKARTPTPSLIFPSSQVLLTIPRTPLLPSARPPPLPLPSTWPKLKKTVRPEPKKVESDANEFFKKKSQTLHQYLKLMSDDERNDNNERKEVKIGEKLIDNDCASLNGGSVNNKDIITPVTNDIGVMNN
ncbi:13974_t:CDS:2 [Cetraspora pellucida]|uniref:13974_t:CDS:1 n=1 Tax=Cetraspora pellucida TaxID=1433469 RepID=A0A9N9GD88_9GLOM|nr:13974_t:CDS:2 [Cetraspora pellucida]